MLNVAAHFKRELRGAIDFDYGRAQPNGFAQKAHSVFKSADNHRRDKVVLQHETEQRGATPGGIFRKVMLDYLGGVYVTVDDLTPETIEVLRGYAKQTFGSARNTQAAISAIVNKWAEVEATRKK